jgi:hypothetical protein
MMGQPGGFDMPEDLFSEACSAHHLRVIGEAMPRAVSIHNSKESLLNLAWVPAFMLEACLRHDGMTVERRHHARPNNYVIPLKSGTHASLRVLDMSGCHAPRQRPASVGGPVE